MGADADLHADQTRLQVRKACFDPASDHFWTQHNGAALIEANDVKRVLANIDADDRLIPARAFAWVCSLSWAPPVPASIAGGARARPDHPISRSSYLRGPTSPVMWTFPWERSRQCSAGVQERSVPKDDAVKAPPLLRWCRQWLDQFLVRWVDRAVDLARPVDRWHRNLRSRALCLSRLRAGRHPSFRAAPRHARGGRRRIHSR